MHEQVEILKHRHWVKGNHICIKCGANLRSIITTSICPVESLKKNKYRDRENKEVKENS